MTAKGGKFIIWSEQEETLIIRHISFSPLDHIEAIARRIAVDLPHRNLSSILTRMKGSKVITSAWREMREAATKKPEPKPTTKAVIEVPHVPSGGGTMRMVGVTIPTPPFDIKVAPRDESLPYDRRASLASTPARPETMPELFKRILKEEFHRERANHHEANIALHHEAGASFRLQ